MSEESFIQHDVENKKLREENKNKNKNDKKNKQFEKNKIIKEEPKTLIGLIKIS